MLQALLDDLKVLADLQLLLPLDERCVDISAPPATRIFVVKPGDDMQRLLPEWIAQADMVWPIAPESNGMLAQIARQVKSRQKILLLSSPETVSICADKLATYRHLKLNGVPVVNTQPLEGLSESPFAESVIKPRDGEGCEGNRILKTPAQFANAMRKLDTGREYIIQPWLQGRALSLSGLFKQGRSWLLCCNQQQIGIRNKQFYLRACLVNVSGATHGHYQHLLDQVALALPDLWGYIGIDLIETPGHGTRILEINPRLTTSYAGIKQATGINVAEQVLQLLRGDPTIHPTRHQSVRVAIH